MAVRDACQKGLRQSPEQDDNARNGQWYGTNDASARRQAPIQSGRDFQLGK